MTDPDANIEIPCARCGKTAARYTVLRAGEGGGLLDDRDRIVRAGFIGEDTWPQPHDEALATVAALRAGGILRLYREHGVFYGLVCEACGRPYCLACWDVGPPEFDEGFYDCTHATCPEGHRQMVDD